jgi:GTP cyclohydrolase I
LRALGHEPAGELVGTGERVFEAWSEDLLSGYRSDPVEVLQRGASALAPLEGDAPRGLVTLRDLPVTTMCPHHLLPAFGTATVLYVPGARLAGLGAVARALDALSRRLTFQETVGEELVAALMTGLEARGAACRLEMTHMCLAARGERKERARVETFAFAGAAQVGESHHALALAALGER